MNDKLRARAEVRKKKAAERLAAELREKAATAAEAASEVAEDIAKRSVNGPAGTVTALRAAGKFKHRLADSRRAGEIAEMLFDHVFLSINSIVTFDA